MTDFGILVTSRGQETLFIALADNRPVYLSRSREKPGGGIYTGRIENYLHNLKAAFVRFDDHEIGYLPLDEVPEGALLNRPYQKGEALKAGDMLCVQMRQPAGFPCSVTRSHSWIAFSIRFPNNTTISSSASLIL